MTNNSKNLFIGSERIDPFYYDQPTLEFIDELKRPLHEAKPSWFGRKNKKHGEANVFGMYLDRGDFQNEALLCSAYEDFLRFLEIYEISGTSYPVKIEKINTDTYESYEINISDKETVIKAGDTEGVRRAIIYLEDEIRRSEGAFLPLGNIRKKPWIKSRITRGFFSPTNRAPKFGDELFDDIDYYPDEYLNRLAHDGANGIWIYTSFRALLTSDFFPEYGEGSEKRIKKLKNVVEKCARYGIKVYVFAIEPMHIVDDIAKAHSDLTGAKNTEFGQHAICLSTEKGRAYLLEAVEKLFTLIPDLGGYIDITSGERLTSCASFPNYFNSCPRCSKRPIGEMLAETTKIIKEGMRRAGTDARFVSWTYGHKNWQKNDILDYVEKCDTDTVLMQNFEENSYAEQLGKVREGKDYWLSHIGPGELFKLTANKAKQTNRTMYAKMQICCSHEVASVPYIPTPGLIFEKYKKAREYDCSGIMQGWYFGNYPSVMSKAAGELSFSDDFKNKEEFIERLASIYYGDSASKKVASAWKLFEEGYSNYPLNIMFSYYGPMHDSVVWQLYLKPHDYYLPRSWQLIDEPNGDRIHEALWQGHTLEETLILCERLVDSWNTGMQMLLISENDEGYTVAHALCLLFKSGKNILKFYKLRRDLGVGEGEPTELLFKMRDIVKEEILNSKEMITVCEKDKRIGYHSEAEGFKFFPKKLRYRISKLEELLETEFREVEERIKTGLSPLEFYQGMNNGKYFDSSYFMNSSESRCFGKNSHAFEVNYDSDNLILKINAKTKEKCVACFEFEPLIPSPAITFGPDGNIDFVSEVYTHHSMFGDKILKEKSKYDLSVTENEKELTYILKIKRNLSGWASDTPLRLRLSVGNDFVKPTEIKLRFLAKWNEYPDMFFWLIP